MQSPVDLEDSVLDVIDELAEFVMRIDTTQLADQHLAGDITGGMTAHAVRHDPEATT
jgi:hypothetical protein